MVEIRPEFRPEFFLLASWEVPEKTGRLSKWETWDFNMGGFQLAMHMFLYLYHCYHHGCIIVYHIKIVYYFMLCPTYFATGPVTGHRPFARAASCKNLLSQLPPLRLSMRAILGGQV